MTVAKERTRGTKSSTESTATASTAPSARSGDDVLRVLESHTPAELILHVKELNRRRFRALLAMRECLAVPSDQPISLAPFATRSNTKARFDRDADTDDRGARFT